MTEEQIAEMRAAAERQLALQNAATPGPFENICFLVVSKADGLRCGPYGGKIITHTGTWDVRDGEEAEANARLFAASRTDPSPANTLQLLAEIERLKAERHALYTERHAVEVTLGKALNYPAIFVDPDSNRIVSSDFPGAVQTDDICIGEHTVETLAEEAAKTLQTLRDELRKGDGNARG